MQQPAASLFVKSARKYFIKNFTWNPLSSGGYTAHFTFLSQKKLPVLDPDGLTTLTTEIETISADADLRTLFPRSTIAEADLSYIKDIASPAEDGFGMPDTTVGIYSVVQASSPWSGGMGKSTRIAVLWKDHWCRNCHEVGHRE